MMISAQAVKMSVSVTNISACQDYVHLDDPNFATLK